MELQVGSILEGKVTSITKFGAFVALEGGRSGLVHISEIANSFVNDVHDFLQEGQTVKVMVLSTDNGKINLSIKKTLPPPERPALLRSPVLFPGALSSLCLPPEISPSRISSSSSSPLPRGRWPISTAASTASGAAAAEEDNCKCPPEIPAGIFYPEIDKKEPPGVKHRAAQTGGILESFLYYDTPPSPAV